MSVIQACQYKNEDYDFTCDEPAIDIGGKFCRFHDINYLKGDNYDKHKEEVAKRFEKKLSEYSSNHRPLKFIGYFLPEISFQRRQFAEALKFSYATFYGKAYFSEAIFSAEADFREATFFGGAYFRKATFSGREFSDEAHFEEATFSSEADFSEAKFLLNLYYARFNHTKFLDKADFYSAIFLCESYFTGTTFKRVSFSEAGFSKEANFRQVNFIDNAEFSDTIFCSGADFYRSIFSNTAYFSAIFKSETFFNYIRFENPNKIIFESEDMSKVSFINTNITKITFSDKTTWGGEKDKDKFTIIEEKWLEDSASRKNNIEKRREVSLGGALSVYRNLRENYEFRLQFDEAGKLFIREMELKRTYTSSPTLACRLKVKLYNLYKKLKRDSSQLPQIEYKVRKNNLLERNLSLTGLYHLFSSYGESIVRPTIIGAITIALSTLFWLMQSNPTLQPSFSSNAHSPYSNFTGLANATNHIQLLKAFERSLADFLPLLSLPGDIKVGVIDSIIKIVGGALTFGLLIIALRRKFERKYTR